MYFENTTKGHSKWLEIRVSPGLENNIIVYISWGKIGSKYLTTIVYNGDLEGAQQKVEELKQFCLTRGYTKKENEL